MYRWWACLSSETGLTGSWLQKLQRWKEVVQLKKWWWLKLFFLYFLTWKPGLLLGSLDGAACLHNYFDIMRNKKWADTKQERAEQCGRKWSTSSLSGRHRTHNKCPHIQYTLPCTQTSHWIWGLKVALSRDTRARTTINGYDGRRHTMSIAVDIHLLIYVYNVWAGACISAIWVCIWTMVGKWHDNSWCRLDARATLTRLFAWIEFYVITVFNIQMKPHWIQSNSMCWNRKGGPGPLYTKVIDLCNHICILYQEMVEMVQFGINFIFCSADTL